MDDLTLLLPCHFTCYIKLANSAINLFEKFQNFVVSIDLSFLFFSYTVFKIWKVRYNITEKVSFCKHAFQSVN